MKSIEKKNNRNEIQMLNVFSFNALFPIPWFWFAFRSKEEGETNYYELGISSKSAGSEKGRSKVNLSETILCNFIKGISSTPQE